MRELILLSDAIKEITKIIINEEDRDRLSNEIQDDYLFVTEDERNDFIVEKITNGNYLVDSDKIYSWLDETYKPLLATSTEITKWKKVYGYLNFQSKLDTYMSNQKFNSRKEMKECMDKLEDENDELQIENIDLRKQIKQQNCIIRETCGKWVIHKIIDEAFYELYDGVNKVSHIEVFRLIKEEHDYFDKSSGKTKKYDPCNKIECCMNEFNEGVVIKWKKTRRGKTALETGNALEGSVDKLHKLNQR